MHEAASTQVSRRCAEPVSDRLGHGGTRTGDTTIFSRVSLHLKQRDFQGFLVVLRLIVRPDFGGLCGRFPDEKANEMAGLPFRRAWWHAPSCATRTTLVPARVVVALRKPKGRKFESSVALDGWKRSASPLSRVHAWSVARRRRTGRRARRTSRWLRQQIDTARSSPLTPCPRGSALHGSGSRPHARFPRNKHGREVITLFLA